MTWSKYVSLYTIPSTLHYWHRTSGPPIISTVLTPYGTHKYIRILLLNMNESRKRLSTRTVQK